MLDSKGFELWAEGYDRDVGVTDDMNAYPFAGYKQALGEVFRAVMERPGSAVLDLGFGTGVLSKRLYDNGFSVYGQDFSERMKELASLKMPGAALYTGDLSQGLAEPLKTLRYDFITATYSLHHLTDEQKAALLRLLLGLLNDGGAILIADVAFETREELDRCRLQAGDEWDDEEFYFVYDELKNEFPALTFRRVSFCAGILTLTK